MATVSDKGTKFSGTAGSNQLIVKIPGSDKSNKSCILINDWMSFGISTASTIGIVTTGSSEFDNH